MVTDMFGVLLQEIGLALENVNLHPDNNNSCLIKLKNGISVQLELDRSRNFFILGCDLGLVPAGRYRENLFKEALKANDLPAPLHGILAYSRKNTHLVLFEKVMMADLTGEKIAAEIAPFSEKALIWTEAIKQGEVPTTNKAFTSDHVSGMFGLRP